MKEEKKKKEPGVPFPGLFEEPLLQVVELEVVDTLTASPEETDGYDWGKIVG